MTLTSAPPLTRTDVDVMGTVVTITVAHHRCAPGSDSGSDSGAAVAAATALLRRTDRTFSPWRRGSEVNRVRRGELAVAGCSRQVAAVLAECERAEAATDGAFCSRWDGWPDPSGLLRGWAAHRASAVLHEAGFPDHTVSAGGDVVCAGHSAPGRAWRVGIVDPHRPGVLVGVVALSDAALATSGTAERGGLVVDPRTGAPAAGLASASAVGRDLCHADALATAAIAEGRADARWMRRLSGYDLLTVDDAGHRWGTPGFARHLVRA